MKIIIKMNEYISQMLILLNDAWIIPLLTFHPITDKTAISKHKMCKEKRKYLFDITKNKCNIWIKHTLNSAHVTFQLLEERVIMGIWN